MRPDIDPLTQRWRFKQLLNLFTYRKPDPQLWDQLKLEGPQMKRGVELHSFVESIHFDNVICIATSADGIHWDKEPVRSLHFTNFHWARPRDKH